MSLLPVCAPAELPERAAGQRWLIESIWPVAGVGIIGGAPKSYKTWMALDLAVSVATGTRCLGTFACSKAGPTLVYAAEDSLPDLRQRLSGIAAQRHCDFRSLNLGVITVDHLHLDREEQLQALDDTLARYKPVLLVLDPFVRLHRGADENSSADVSHILGALRRLQRRHQTAIALVHHARKNTRGARLGQGLRGSSDFHAWGDVNLYLNRDKRGVLLTSEHRSSASPEPFHVGLTEAQHPALVRTDVASPRPAVRDGLEARLLHALDQLSAPTSQNRLRKLVQARNKDVAGALKVLLAAGQVRRTNDGWLAALDRQTSFFPS